MLGIVQTQHSVNDELAVVVAEEVVHARVVGAGAAGVGDEGEEGGEGPGGHGRGGGGGVGYRRGVGAWCERRRRGVGAGGERRERGGRRQLRRGRAVRGVFRQGGGEERGRAAGGGGAGHFLSGFV